MTEVKKRSLKTPPSTLIRMLDVELDTEHSLEECLELLEDADRSGIISFYDPLHVQIEAADANGVTFAMNRYGARSVSWFIGEIKPTANGSNVVIGQVGISPDIVFYLGMLALFPLGALITKAVIAVFLALAIAAAVGGIGWYSAQRSRYELIDRLEEIL